MPHEISQAHDELSSDDLTLLDRMIDALVEDVDSCWTSSISCCDSCFDEYRAKWPLAYTSSRGIQYQSMPADLFYTGSKHLEVTVSEQDFERLLPYVGCPNCGGPLGPNLFAFELPFNSDEFMGDLERLSDLASKAPFLVATDPFAQTIAKEIAALCAATRSELPSGDFYRAREIEFAKAIPDDFGPPPPSVTKEGRYNHAGRPTLYISNAYATCWEECRRPGVPFSIATLGFVKPVRLLDLSEPEDMAGVMASVMYSNLTAAPSDGAGWDRPEYVLTRFVADCARVAGVDGIRYLSTRVGGGCNIVLLDGSKAMDVIQVTKIEELKAPRSPPI